MTVTELQSSNRSSTPYSTVSTSRSALIAPKATPAYLKRRKNPRTTAIFSMAGDFAPNLAEPYSLESRKQPRLEDVQSNHWFNGSHKNAYGLCPYDWFQDHRLSVVNPSVRVHAERKQYEAEMRRCQAMRGQKPQDSKLWIRSSSLLCG
jgi:hypothetical protein